MASIDDKDPETRNTRSGVPQDASGRSRNCGLESSCSNELVAVNLAVLAHCIVPAFGAPNRRSFFLFHRPVDQLKRIFILGLFASLFGFQSETTTSIQIDSTFARRSVDNLEGHLPFKNLLVERHVRLRRPWFRDAQDFTKFGQKQLRVCPLGRPRFLPPLDERCDELGFRISSFRHCVVGQNQTSRKKMEVPQSIEDAN